MRNMEFSPKPGFQIEVENGYEYFIPQEFQENPIEYFEREGKNIKTGEIKFDENRRVLEDPTTVKDLHVWRNNNGKELHVVAKRVNTGKGEMMKSGDPFYEYKILKLVQELGLLAAKPVAKVEKGNVHLIIMERIFGVRWSEKDSLNLKERGYSNKDIENLKMQAESKMEQLKKKFEEAGIIRGWKLKDMVFDVDIENKIIRGIVPTDWERTKIEKQSPN